MQPLSSLGLIPSHNVIVFDVATENVQRAPDGEIDLLQRSPT